jgi:nucleoid-associated protein YgaU
MTYPGTDHPQPPESIQRDPIEPGTCHVVLHTVEHGDTLETIASRYYGHGIDSHVIGRNNGHVAHALTPGDVLVIPQ